MVNKKAMYVVVVCMLYVCSLFQSNTDVVCLIVIYFIDLKQL